MGQDSYGSIIRERIPMTDVARRYGLRVNRQGYAVCPFHAEKTGSFRVYPGTGGWHCFGCGEGGSVIDFVMKYFELDYKQAVSRLMYDFGIPMPDRRMMTLRERERVRQELALRKQRNDVWQERWKTAQESWKQAFERWLELSRRCDNERPRDPSETFSSAYVHAVQHLPDARYDLEQAEDDLIEIEKERGRGNERAAG